jgi:hypothetical protein
MNSAAGGRISARGPRRLIAALLALLTAAAPAAAFAGANSYAVSPGAALASVLAGVDSYAASPYTTPASALTGADAYETSPSAAPPTSAFAGETDENGAGGVNSPLSFSVRTLNEHRLEDGQLIEATILFRRPIQVLPGAEADLTVRIAGGTLDEAPNTEDGESNRTLSVRAGEDGAALTIRIGSVPGASFVKHTNARLEIAAAETGVSHILDAETGEAASLGYFSCIIPSGLSLAGVENVSGGAAPALARKRVDGLSNIRSMIYIQALVNGEPLFPDRGDGRKGSYVIHAHLFTTMRAEDYAGSIAAGFAAAAKQNPGVADGYEMRADGDVISLRALREREGEVLDFRVFEWPIDGGGAAAAPPASARDEAAGFTDVTGWEKEYVDYLLAKGLVEGRPPDGGDSGALFDPNALVTRAEFTKMLALLADADLERYPPSGFSDVPEGAWYAPYAAWAAAEELASGDQGSWRPDAPLLRQDLAVLLTRFSGKIRKEALPAMETPARFSDHGRIADYALDAVYALREAGVVEENVNGQFLPPSSYTRGQCARVLALYMHFTDL